MHRRRVYLDYGSSRRARAEGWFSLSIYLSAAVLLLSLLGCLPEVMSSISSWLLPERASYRLGLTSGTVQTSGLEILMVISGAYLVVALFLKSHTR
jgi:hypothetical protein